jgi:hypothetical protein
MRDVDELKFERIGDDSPDELAVERRRGRSMGEGGRVKETEKEGEVKGTDRDRDADHPQHADLPVSINPKSLCSRQHSIPCQRRSKFRANCLRSGKSVPTAAAII